MPTISDPVTGTRIAREALPTDPIRRLHPRDEHIQDLIFADAGAWFDYWIDLRAALEEGEEVAAVRAWSVPSDLLIPDLDFAGKGVVLWLAGGYDTIRYEVTCQIDTTDMRTLDHRITYVVAGNSPWERTFMGIPSTATVGRPTVTVIVVPAPIIAIAPDPPVFAATTVGEVKTAAVTITNTGDAPITILGFGSTGDFTASLA